MSVKAKANPLKDFNLNSALVLVATAAIGWMVNNGLGSIKATHDTAIQTQNSVGKIETAIPYINQSVSHLQDDLNAKNVSLSAQITDVKNDVKSGQTQTWAAIKDVRDTQTKFQEQLTEAKK